MTFKYQRSEKLENLLGLLRGYSESEQILFGQQNAGHIGVSISVNDGSESDCKNLCGKHPAVIGIDTLSFLGYEGNMTELCTVVKNMHRQGAIFTLSSHMPNFTLGGEEFYDYSSNYTEGDCARRIMPGGDLNSKYRKFLDLIAEFTERCVDVEGEKIPMLFRPFHECNGDWFWWGKSFITDEEYKELFRYTVDYLMSDKNVDNLAVAYSPNGKISNVKDYLSRYPGDEYVDVMGLDQYHDKPRKGDGYYHRLASYLDILFDASKEHGKIPALTETGYRSLETENGYFEGLSPIDNTVKNWFTQNFEAIYSTEGGRHLAYMLVWANFSDTQFWIPFVTEDFRHEMCDDFISFAGDERIKMAPLFDLGGKV